MKTRNKNLLLISGVLILALIPVLIYFKLFYEPRFLECKLVRVVGIDTFVVDVKGKDERVRLLYTHPLKLSRIYPEIVETIKEDNEWIIVSAEVKEMLSPGKKIILEKEEGIDRDYEGRLLRYMFIPGETRTREGEKYFNFNVWLVKFGLGIYSCEFGESGKYHKEFKKAEKYNATQNLNPY